MKHFTLEEWANFARRITLPEQKQKMQRHLDDGCSRCLKALEIWRRVWNIARSENSYQPSESAVHFVKGAYAAGTLRKTIFGRAKLARLVFDSFRQAALPDVRASGRGTRQTVHKSGRFLIDMRMELQPGSKRICLTGQVLDSTGPDRTVNDLSLFLVREQQLLARTTTNQFGEFHLEFAQSGKHRVLVQIPEERAIAVPLQRLAALRARASAR